MEILFTGFSSLKRQEHRLIAHTSVWMFPIYGMASLFGPISRRIKDKNILYRGCVYMLMIYAGEFITGSILRKYDACPWDYSQTPYHICGLIRLDYAPWWFAAGLVFEKFMEFTKDSC